MEDAQALLANCGAAKVDTSPAVLSRGPRVSRGSNIRETPGARGKIINPETLCDRFVYLSIQPLAQDSSGR